MASESKDMLLQVITPNVSRIKTKEDLIVTCVHGFLISKGYRTGLSGKDNGNKLPESWNESDGIFELHYQYKAKEYLLKVLKIDGALSFYLYESNSEGMTELTLNINDFVEGEDFSPNTTLTAADYTKILKNIELLKSKIVKLHPSEEVNKESSKETSVHREIPDQFSRENRGLPTADPLLVSHHSPRYDPYEYGQADLFPGGIGSGGMHFDPFRSEGRFGGSDFGAGGCRFPGRVPGARFDPVGPLPGAGFGYLPRGPGGPRRPRFPGEPDSDHMRPPGFDDDMFM